MKRRDTHTLQLPIRDEIIVDSFAGGGGASTGIEHALGRPVDVAINHNAEAIAMHAINHPGTTHYIESVFKVDPESITGNQPVGLLWASPDCTHFSKAKGDAPRSPRVRGLAWVVIRWARRVKPRVIMLENVEEFEDWGPLLEDGRPCPDRRGKTFLLWVNQLRGSGYQVEWRQLRACDYGAPTIRKRLFLIARRDGLPIVWPTATHGPGRSQAYRTAADCIDWSLPCPSIFDRTRPLAEATMRRVAAGVMRYVVNAAEPFIVPLRGTSAAHRSAHSVDAPLSTVSAGGTHHALVSPTLVQTGYGERDGQAPRALDLGKPLGTVVSGGKHALVAAFLAKHYGGVVGSDLRDPLGTVTRVDHHSLITTELAADRRETVRAFLTKYYGTPQDPQLRQPLHTVTTKDRFGLVTVAGETFAIADIGLRMLQPRELYRAQGFPEDYVIDFEYRGKRLPKSSQVRMCGNSVSPPVVQAMVTANFAHESAWKVAA